MMDQILLQVTKPTKKILNEKLCCKNKIAFFFPFHVKMLDCLDCVWLDYFPIDQAEK